MIYTPIYFDNREVEISRLCNKCGGTKPIIEFGIRSPKKFINHEYGYARNYQCKECINTRNQKYYSEHVKESKIRNYKYYQENKEEIKVVNKKYRDEHMKELKEKALEYRKSRREYRNIYAAKYRMKHKEKIRLRGIEYRVSNKEKRNIVSRKHYTNNPQHKLNLCIRNRLNHAIRRGDKAGSGIKDMGCSVGFLEMYLESMFYDNSETGTKMTWGNWGFGKGKWNIDHILPISKFDLTDREEFLQVVHFKNLQPLWFEHNQRRRYQTMVEQLRDAMIDVLRRSKVA